MAYQTQTEEIQKVESHKKLGLKIGCSSKQEKEYRILIFTCHIAALTSKQLVPPEKRLISSVDTINYILL